MYTPNLYVEGNQNIFRFGILGEKKREGERKYYHLEQNICSKPCAQNIQ
ncbi:hypothetical protein X975_17948, partial [Stegodyphus mimosarum]